jgi:acyl transferase domain-containing protein/NAD(P)-dependent dehydrogenase (short-subunit alcohol dehydrogenase family)/acyl carrier protein
MSSNRLAPVAITGIGCLFPKATGRSMFWSNIKNGRDCITDIPQSHWSVDDYFDPDPNRPDHTYSRTGGFLDPVRFDPMEFGIAPNAVEAVDTSQLLTLLAVKQALMDAGYENGRISDRDRVSVILGVTGAQQLVIPLGARLYHPLVRKTLMECGLTGTEADEITRRINHKLVGWQEGSFPGLLGNVVAGRVTNRFDFGGTNCVVDAACAGSLAAVQTACMELQTGRSDLVVSGGADTFNDIFMYMCFSKSKALSPSGHARPFDKSADGTTIGEGIGIILLKRLDDAERDGDTVYAVIRGLGTSSDGRGNAIYAPSASGQKKALERAYMDAGITPDTIELVEAHGTGTPVGDAIELDALTDIFRKSKPDGTWCALGSVKAQIGHGKATAGAAGLIKAALALHHRVIPPAAKVTNPAQPLASGRSPFYLPSEQRPWLSTGSHPRRAAVSSFGFGGSNYHCVLEEHSGTQPGPDWDETVQIAAFSARSSAELVRQVTQWQTPETPDEFRAAAQETRKQFNPEDSHRLLMVITDNAQCSRMIAAALDRLKTTPDESWDTPDGIFYGTGKPPGKLAAVFPGQGTQYPGMLRDTACRFPVFRETLEAADRAFSQHSGGSIRLSDIVYPPSSFSDEQINAHIDTLKQTQYAQPGIGAVSMGAWAMLTRHFDIKIDAAAGHSYGEICAMCASGMITAEEFHYLSSLRGHLMSAGLEDRGGMAAIQAAPDDISAILKEDKLDLVIANKNAPQQAVVSGRSDEIARAVECFKKRRITITPLNVSAAFHSPLVADASRPFGEYLEKVTFQKGTFAVYSNTTGGRYPVQQKKTRDILAAQLEKPVEFVSEIRQMAADGIRTFLEIGPGKRMTGLIRVILEGSDVHLIALDSSAGKRTGSVDMARALADLARLGYRVNLAAWDGDFVLKPKSNGSKVQVTLTGMNYVREKPSMPPFTIQRAPVSDKGPMQPPHGETFPSVSDAFSAVQQNLAGLQRLQEQTARLHQQFLTGQLEAQQAFQNLIAQQQHVLTGTPGTPAFAPQPAVPSPAEKPQRIPAALPIPEPVRPAPVLEKTDLAAQQSVLRIISEKTGYPVDLLEPGMELDADLGIDSIKRVEILSALQEENPELPPVGPERMAGIRSLNDIISLLDGLTAAAPGTPAPDPQRLPASPAKPASPFDTKSIPGRKPAGHAHSMEFIKAVMSEKTGYPADLLEPDMELDGDLGIDSIKRVEIMSALQEKVPGLPAIKPDQLAGLRTISDIANLVDALGGTVSRQGSREQEKLSGTVPQAPAHRDLPGTAPPARTPGAAAAGDDVLPAREPEKTGPVASAAETGRKQAEIRVSDQKTAVSPKPAVEKVKRRAKPLTRPVLPDTLNRLDRKILSTKPVDKGPRKKILLPEHAEIWITRDDCGLSELLFEELENRYIPVRLVSPDYLEFVELPNEVAGLIIVGPRDACDTDYIVKVFELIKLISNKIRRPNVDDGRRPALISLLRLDGAFGLNNRLVDFRPVTAAFSGLLKTIRLEWPETQCRIIDIDADPAYQPDIPDLMEEIFYDSPFETGLSARGKVQLVLEDMPIEPDRLTGEPLSPGDWILATGGGRGVTAACVLELARRFRVNVVIAGRSPAPEPEPAWLAGLVNEADIKEAILAQQEEKPAPKELQARFVELMKNRELLRTCNTLEMLGVQVRYESLDISNPDAQKRLFKDLSNSNIQVLGLVHGAGIIADKLIEDKPVEDFDRVFRTKVDSLRFLADNLELDKLKIMVLFSSSTARFGRVGQVDYGMANEVLNKFAAKFSRMYPGCRTLSINWGPWNGGMVTPDLKSLFKKEGIEVIDVPSGARYLARELRMEYGKTIQAPVEIVILGTREPDTDLPGDIDPVQPDGDFSDTTLEMPISIPSADEPAESPPPDEPSERVTPGGITTPPAEPEWVEVFRTLLSTDRVPVLKSHLINDRPVVPMSLLMEWAALGASRLHPPLFFHSLENFRLLKGIILRNDEPVELECKAGKSIREGRSFRIPIEIRGIHPIGEKFVHVTSDVIMVTRLPEAPEPPEPLDNPEPYPIHQAQLYDEVLFHGEMLQSIRSIEGVNETGISAAIDGAPMPDQWMRHPLNATWILDPMSIDASFQLVILWTELMLDMPSLPCGLAAYRQYVKTMPPWGTVEIRIQEHRKAQVFADIYFLDMNRNVVAVIEKYECITDKGLRQAFQIRHDR